MRPTVYHYLNYREFLRDSFEAEKKRSPSFSYRYVARHVGVRTPGHLKRIIDGERRLTDELAPRYADTFHLRGRERSYFVSLVRFNNAKQSAAREAAYLDLTKFRGFAEIHQLDTNQAAFCREWYIPAIRELVTCDHFVDDPAWIAGQLQPRISVANARRALRTLLDLKLLARVDGRLVQTSATISTGVQPQSLHIAGYHRAVLERASECIDEFPAAERDLSALTLCVPDAAIDELKDRMAVFRQELLAEYGSRTDGTRVCTLSMQLFPMNRKSKP